MTAPFVRARPLQAGKLAAVVATLAYTAAGVAGVVPGWDISGLFVVVILGGALVLVVAAETAVAGARALLADDGVVARLAARPPYTVVRAVEAGGAAAAAGGVAVVLASLPSGEMAGPGAIGLLFLVAGLALVPPAGVLLRGLAELHYHRGAAAA
jgi:hypothetical protein